MTTCLILGLVAGPRGWAQPQSRPHHPANPPGIVKPKPPRDLFERLQRMTPEQRERMLGRLPPEKREMILDYLKKYEQLQPSERSLLRQQYQRFQELPPERQQQVREFFDEMKQLPPEKRRQLMRAASFLSHAPPEKRREVLNSPRFRSRFNTREQQLLRQAIEVMEILELDRRPPAAAKPGAMEQNEPDQEASDPEPQ